ncbi:hypothetical protein MPTK1_4g01450 [Marchantia polymorpha subsp. ruderalis]|uniref:Uncharacterized protein n=2 Tax=Marchantia polymorpha TaxID=3197 RepID=A0AAF6B566_MARPO|nr:hypothetical protein MARPO_0098s0057 [Marchantia polymorpha]BBN07150.1 hypothetical protein Mp_4g01450 [Marchantia polymorpha subsp. ruderalis]|eukprot:PTQ32511.1 hypothetical protein MARPO_0098s0057 [Marchantia polymorpha]
MAQKWKSIGSEVRAIRTLYKHNFVPMNRTHTSQQHSQLFSLPIFRFCGTHGPCCPLRVLAGHSGGGLLAPARPMCREGHLLQLWEKVHTCKDHQRDQLILRKLQRSDFRRRPKGGPALRLPVSRDRPHRHLGRGVQGVLVHNGRERLRKAAATTHGRMQHRRREWQAGRLRGGRLQEVQNGPKCIDLAHVGT